jgi:hypothetical protein
MSESDETRPAGEPEDSGEALPESPSGVGLEAPSEAAPPEALSGGGHEVSPELPAVAAAAASADTRPAATAVTGALAPSSGRTAPPEALSGGGRTAPPEPPSAAAAKSARPDLSDRRDPLYREVRGYKLRLDPPDLARLRELPGSRGRSDTEIGEAFFDGQAERLAAALADDVPEPAELRVVVDPYSRQAFLALEGTIRGILSF